MCHTTRHSVTEIVFNNYKDEILKLRQTVWEQTDHLLMEQLFVNGFYDEHDNDCFHWGVFNGDNKLIASARLSKHNTLDTLPNGNFLRDILELNIQLPVASLNRLVIDTKYQGQGLSDLLDKIRIKKAIEIGCISVCGITYGQRSKKFLNEGFSVFHSSLLTGIFKTSKENAKQFPLAFYYKLTKNGT